jgi:hypothetical protein
VQELPATGFALVTDKEGILAGFLEDGGRPVPLILMTYDDAERHRAGFNDPGDIRIVQVEINTARPMPAITFQNN